MADLECCIASTAERLGNLLMWLAFEIKTFSPKNQEVSTIWQITVA